MLLVKIFDTTYCSFQKTASQLLTEHCRQDEIGFPSEIIFNQLCDQSGKSPSQSTRPPLQRTMTARHNANKMLQYKPRCARRKLSRDDVVFVNPVVMIEILLHFYVHCHTGVTYNKDGSKETSVRRRKMERKRKRNAKRPCLFTRQG